MDLYGSLIVKKNSPYKYVGIFIRALVAIRWSIAGVGVSPAIGIFHYSEYFISQKIKNITHQVAASVVSKKDTTTAA